ncbi:hypothetical protein NUITMVS1_15690 [Shewanella xiamenensis]|nr:hypothetical protein NUITMVS1_15690 [Shewanella xiamenensis]
MQRVERAACVVKDTLDGYREEFDGLVREYANFSYTQGEAYCDFFVDIASMMNGSWLLTAKLESDMIANFKSFDWYRILATDEAHMPEDELSALLQTAYKIGYIWLIERLSSLKQQIEMIEIRLYHNGSLDYQALN